MIWSANDYDADGTDIREATCNGRFGLQLCLTFALIYTNSVARNGHSANC